MYVKEKLVYSPSPTDKIMTSVQTQTNNNASVMVAFPQNYKSTVHNKQYLVLMDHLHLMKHPKPAAY